MACKKIIKVYGMYSGMKKHNILYPRWEGTFASPKTQQVNSLKNVLWAFTCQIQVVASKRGPQSWDDWETMHRVILPTPKLNSSDSQVSWGGIFCYPSVEEGHSCLVQECYEDKTFSLLNLYILIFNFYFKNFLVTFFQGCFKTADSFEQVCETLQVVSPQTCIKTNWIGTIKQSSKETHSPNDPNPKRVIGN
jgi:hypothetical protein